MRKKEKDKEALKIVHYHYQIKARGVKIFRKLFTTKKMSYST